MHAHEHLTAPHRRGAVLAAPVLVPVSMAATFTVLRRLLGPRWGYNAGFCVYWAGWCAAFPGVGYGWQAGTSDAVTGPPSCRLRQNRSLRCPRGDEQTVSSNGLFPHVARTFCPGFAAMNTLKAMPASLAVSFARVLEILRRDG